MLQTSCFNTILFFLYCGEDLPSVGLAIYFSFTLFKKYRQIFICNLIRQAFQFTFFNKTRTCTATLHGDFCTEVYPNRSRNMEYTDLILSTPLNTVWATVSLFSWDTCLPDNVWWGTAVLKSLTFDIHHKLIYRLMTTKISVLWWYTYKDRKSVV
jgi:hypothetical protein